MKIDSENIKKISEDLIAIIDTWKSQQHSAKLVSEVLQLQKSIEDKKHYYDLFLFGTPALNELQTTFNWLLFKPEDLDSECQQILNNQQSDCKKIINLSGNIIRLITNENDIINSISKVPSNVLISVLSNDQSIDIEDVYDQISHISDFYQIIIFINLSNNLTWNNNRINHICRDSRYVSNISFEQLIDSTIEAFLKNNIKPEHFELLQSISIIKTLEIIHKNVSFYLDSEKKTIESKKISIQMDSLMIENQAAKDSRDNSEISIKTKKIINDDLLEFERTLRSNLDNYLKSQINGINHIIKTTNDSIISLEETKKSKSIVLTIPEKTIKTLFEDIFNSFKGQGLGYIDSINDAMVRLTNQIESTFELSKLPVPKPDFNKIDPEELISIIKTSLFIEKPYSGEFGRKGFSEYFMAVRKYQMMFFMVISIFGLSKFKSNWLITILITLPFLGFGIYRVINSVEKEREENLEKEIIKARESLTNEIKRIGNEISRQWLLMFSDYFRAQRKKTNDEIDNFIKAYFSRKKNEFEENNKKFRMIQQGVNQSEKKLDQLTKDMLYCEKNILKINKDLFTLFSKI